MKHQRYAGIFRCIAIFSVIWVTALVLVCPLSHRGLLHAEAAKTKTTGSSVDWESILEGVGKNSVQDLNTHLMLAVSYANLGMIPEATREFRIIESSGYQEFGKEVIRENSEKVKGSPDDIISLNLLAFAYYAFGEYEEFS